MMRRLEVVLALTAGAAIGWVRLPFDAARAGVSVWRAIGLMLAVPVWRWVPWVVAAAWVESRWSADAVGDGGRSVGALQYLDVTRDEVAGLLPGFDASNPVWAGRAAALYTVARLGDRPARALAWLWSPVGWLAWRWAWRAGAAPSWSGVRSAWSGASGGHATAERRAYGVVMLVAVVVAAVLVAVVRARR